MPSNSPSPRRFHLHTTPYDDQSHAPIRAGRLPGVWIRATRIIAVGENRPEIGRQDRRRVADFSEGGRTGRVFADAAIRHVGDADAEQYAVRREHHLCQDRRRRAVVNRHLFRR